MNRLLETKRNIILHFGQKSNWTNLFDDSFIDSALRRSRTTTSGKSTITQSKDGKFTRVAHDPTRKSQSEAFLGWYFKPANAPKEAPAFLEITKENDTFIIRDESDRVFTVSAETLTAPNGTLDEGVRDGKYDDIAAKIDRDDDATVKLSGLNARIHFARDGRKSLVFDGARQAFSFDEPTGYSQTPAVFTKFLNRVTFGNEFARSFGLDLKSDFLTPAKLFVAVDLGVEPDIKLFNKLDEDRGIELLAYLIERRDEGRSVDSKGADYDVDLLQQAWEDSVDFEGYYVAVARQFGIALDSDPDRYHFNFSADSKEFLMAQGLVLGNAIESGLNPSRILQKNPSLQNLMHVMDVSGEMIPGHQEANTEWRTIVIESEKAGAMARQARQMFIDHFDNDFSRNFVSSVRFDDDRYLLAVREDAYQAAKAVMDASMQAAGLVRSGSQDAELFRELLEAGASLRYVDPENAKKGEGFSSLLRKSQNTALMGVMEDIHGPADMQIQGLEYSS